MDNHFPLLVRVPHRPEGFDMPLEVMVARLERLERVPKATYQVICLTPGASGSKQSAGTMQHPAAKNVLARRSGKACSTPLEFHHECHPLPRSALKRPLRRLAAGAFHRPSRGIQPAPTPLSPSRIPPMTLPAKSKSLSGRVRQFCVIRPMDLISYEQNRLVPEKRLR